VKNPSKLSYKSLANWKRLLFGDFRDIIGNCLVSKFGAISLKIWNEILNFKKGTNPRETSREERRKYVDFEPKAVQKSKCQDMRIK